MPFISFLASAESNINFIIAIAWQCLRLFTFANACRQVEIKGSFHSSQYLRKLFMKVCSLLQPTQALFKLREMPETIGKAAKFYFTKDCFYSNKKGGKN